MGDYSSTLTIHNNLNVGLRFVDKTSPIGFWLRQPDRGILDNDRSNQMQLKDEAGLHGTDGTVTYKASIGDEDVRISIYVACPFGKANIARITSSNDKLVKVSMGGMDGSDHPLIMDFFVSPA